MSMRRSALGIVFLVGVAGLAPGCVDQRYFAPRENENGTGPSGFPAAIYPFAESAGEQVIAGEVRLWSDGGRGEDRIIEGEDGEVFDRRVEVHVGFEVENTGDRPVELGGIRAEGPELALVRVDGSTRAGPGQTARVDTWFHAPEARSTREVSDFAVRYTVVADDEPIVTQVTPFSTWRPTAAYGGPVRRFYGGPWGWGWGIGWGAGYGYWGCW